VTEADLEQDRQHHPQRPDAEKPESRPGGDPPDAEEGDGEDQQRADGDADLPGGEVADERHEQNPPQDAVDRLGGDDDQPDGCSPKQQPQAHFSSTSSITTGVFALIECFRPAGMWTQVPAFASCVSSPRPIHPSVSPARVALYDSHSLSRYR
jgi:hypothetical protein